jgi:hypothetical protein
MTPIVEQIVEKVRARLATITTGNGYETTAAGVTRPKLIDDGNPRDYDIYVTQGDMTVVPELSCTGNPPATAYRQQVVIAGILRPSERDTTPLDKLKNVFASDCIKAMTTGATWWDWDGLAIDTAIDSVTNETEDDGSGGSMKLTINILFRTDDNDPYSLR